MATKTVRGAFEREMHRNWGKCDAQYDIAHGMRNREYVRKGELYCLPEFDRDYSAGYIAAWRERN